MSERPERSPESTDRANIPPQSQGEEGDISRRDFMRLMTAAGAGTLGLAASGSPSRAEEEKNDKGKIVRDGWEPVQPAFKTKKEELDPTVKIQEDGTVALANRGMLLSRKEFPKGATVRFKWSWTSEEPQQYPDHLAIALRTDGKQKEKWSFEIDDALVVRLNPHSDGAVIVQRYRKGQEETELGRKPDVDLKTGDVHDFEISDLGESIVVKIDGKEVLRQKVDPQDGSGKKVAIYNREPVAGVRKVSTVDHLTINETGKE